MENNQLLVESDTSANTLVDYLPTSFRIMLYTLYVKLKIVKPASETENNRKQDDYHLSHLHSLKADVLKHTLDSSQTYDN